MEGLLNRLLPKPSDSFLTKNNIDPNDLWKVETLKKWYESKVGELEYDVKKVQDDVRNDRISLRRAKEVYGVVMDEKTLEVDIEETRKLREALKEQRGVPATALTVPLDSGA